MEDEKKKRFRLFPDQIKVTPNLVLLILIVVLQMSNNTMLKEVIMLLE